MKRVVAIFLILSLALSAFPVSGAATEVDGFTGEPDETISDSSFQPEKTSITESPITIESISISSVDTTIAVGDTLSLTASVFPENADNKSIAWTVSDESILTVDNNGVVTAISAGNAVVSAYAQDSNNVYARIELQVISSIDDEITDDDTLIDVYFDCNPSELVLSVYSENGDVVFPEDGNHYRLAVGNYTYDAELDGYVEKRGILFAVEHSRISIPVELVAVETPNLVSSTYSNSVVASGSCGDDVIWSLDSEGVLSICRPEELTDTCTGAMNGYLLSRTPWYKYRNSIITINIGYGVTSIGYNAFMNCTNVTNVSIPVTVTSIGYSAFENCSSLESIAIPGNVKKIDQFSFKSCSALEYVILPDSISDIASQAFYGCSKLSEINIPDGISSIGSNAFAGCRSITNIAIPDGVARIEDGTFRACTSLSSVAIPDSVTAIGKEAFYNCTGLISASIPNSVATIGSMAFYSCSSLEKVNIGNLENWCGITFENSGSNPLSNGASLYVSNEPVTQLYVPSGIDSIHAYAFYNCTSLTSIDVPESVTSIGEAAFFECTNVSSLDISCGTTSIGSQAFQSCNTLSSVHIPPSVTTIGANAFYGCNSLTEVCIDDISAWCSVCFSKEYSNPLYYGGKLYINNELGSEIIIPSDVTVIKDYSFVNCSSLTSVTISDSVTNIGVSAFSGCKSLTSVYTDSLEAWCRITFDSISSNPLSNKAALYLNKEFVTQLIIPEQIPEIKNYSFYGCKGLESIVISEGITQIGEAAFGNCTSIISVEIPESVTEIGMSAFSECSSLASVTIPYQVRIIGEKAFNKCTGMASLEIADGVKEIGSSAFNECTNLSSVAIPASMKQIGENAFYMCRKLQQVTISDLEAWCSIEFTNGYSNPLYYASKLFLDGVVDNLIFPSDVTSIGNYAFYGFRGVTSIMIPSGITSIGQYAFAGCGNLTFAEIPSSVVAMGEYAFAECGKLSSVTIPVGISSISRYTFWKCTGLTNVTIPKTVTSIGYGAFMYCGSLEDIFYPESADEWNNVVIESGNDPLNNARIHYNYGKGPFAISVTTNPAERIVQVTDQNNQSISSAYCGDTVRIICYDDSDYELDYVIAPNAKDLLPAISSEGQAFTFTMPDCDVEIEAVYKERVSSYSYKISFNKNATKATGTMNEITGNTLTGGTLPANIFKYSNKAFAGWNTKPDGTGISYADGERIENIVSEDNTAITLYAQWRNIRYSVEFKAEGITVGTVELDYGEKYKLEDFGACKYGYHVGSWKNASNNKNYSIGASVYNLTTKDGAVVIFNANWTENTYSIAYNGNGCLSVKIKPLKVTYNKKFTLASGSYKYLFGGCQYELKGWSMAPLEPSIDYTYDYLKGKAFTAAECAELTKAWANGTTKTLYAVWGPVEYKINYKNVPYGATNPNPIWYNSVRGVNSFLNLDAPGYEFYGWYSDSKCRIPLSGIPGGQTGTKTVYAKVSPISYSISYDLNGGTNSKKNPTTYNITRKITLSNPSRTGYTFDGWYLGDARIKSLNKDAFYGGDIVLAAKWNPIAYTVKYNANGGIFAQGTATTQRVSYDQSVELLTRSAISKAGYTLTGWNTRADCAGASYWISTSNLSAKPTTVNLYAMWEYPIILHGCFEGSVDNELNLYYNQSRKLTNEGFSRPGYTFKGWAISAENAAGGKVKYANNKTIKNLSPGTQLWAVWSANSVKITFNKNDGTKSPAKKTMTLKTGVNLPDTLFSREELQILAWNTKSDGSGTAFRPNEPVANVATRSSSSLTLYAIWGVQEGYQISFNANGGTGNMDTVILKSGDTIPECAFTAPNGKVFAGWRIDDKGSLIAGSTKVDDLGVTAGTLIRVTLYAQWASNGCTATTFTDGCDELKSMFTRMTKLLNPDATDPVFSITGYSCPLDKQGDRYRYHEGCSNCNMNNVLAKLASTGIVSQSFADSAKATINDPGAGTCQGFHNIACYYLFGNATAVQYDSMAKNEATTDTDVKAFFQNAKKGDKIGTSPNHPMIIVSVEDDGVSVLDNNSVIGAPNSNMIRIHKFTWTNFRKSFTLMKLYRYPKECTARYQDIS